MQGSGHQESAQKVFKQMSLIRHLAIHEVNHRSGEEDDEDNFDNPNSNVYDEPEEHKEVQKSPLLLFDDKKSLSEEDINEIKNQIGQQRQMQT